MHPRSLIPVLLLALPCLAGAGESTVRIDCRPAHGGPCAAPPQPPQPPAPPRPPAPPALDPTQPARPPAPPSPALPALPAPPAPPALPEIPPQAHAACAGKRHGSIVGIELGPDETMRGRCERVDGRMVFQLRSYRRG